MYRDKILLIAVLFAGEERSKSRFLVVDFCTHFSALRHPIMHCEKRLKSHAGSLLLTPYIILT